MTVIFKTLKCTVLGPVCCAVLIQFVETPLFQLKPARYAHKVTAVSTNLWLGCGSGFLVVDSISLCIPCIPGRHLAFSAVQSLKGENADCCRGTLQVILQVPWIESTRNMWKVARVQDSKKSSTVMFWTS